MQQIKLMSKFGLALIAITAISVVMATHAYYIQAADAQAKLPNNSVTSATIVNGQVKTEDIASGAINLNVHQVRGEVVEVGAHTDNTAFADCPDGEILTGGGFVADYPIHVGLSSQHPNGDNAWAVTGFNEDSSPHNMRAFALCVDPSIP